jgi:hypothetical protein
VGERDLPGLGDAGAATDQARPGDGVVGSAEGRTQAGGRTVGEAAAQGVEGGHLQGLLGSQIGEQPGEGTGQHRLSRASWIARSVSPMMVKLGEPSFSL